MRGLLTCHGDYKRKWRNDFDVFVDVLQIASKQNMPRTRVLSYANIAPVDPNHILKRLVALGFVSYNFGYKENVIVTEKGRNWLRNAQKLLNEAGFI